MTWRLDGFWKRLSSMSCFRDNSILKSTIPITNKDEQPLQTTNYRLSTTLIPRQHIQIQLQLFGYTGKIPLLAQLTDEFLESGPKVGVVVFR